MGLIMTNTPIIIIIYKYNVCFFILFAFNIMLSISTHSLHKNNHKLMNDVNSSDTQVVQTINCQVSQYLIQSVVCHA